MSGPSKNILTYFPYIRSPLTNIFRAYCDIRSVFFIISRAFVNMYSARFTTCCQNFVICGSFSYHLALHSLRLTANVDLNAALTSSGNVMSSTKSLMSKLSDDIPTLHRRNVSFQAPSFPKRFADGNIDPHIILAMSDSCLIRLGVETRGPRPPQRKLQTVR